jgi:rhamnose transport system permease protein
MTAPHTLLKSREALLLIAGTVLLGLIALRAPDFVAPGNLAAVFTDSAILIILAIGQTAVILTRSIDLSVAANLALTGMAGAMLNAAHPELPVPLLVLASAGMGLGLGAVNGLLVWRIGLPSIVVTLGTLTIFRGAAFVLSGGEWVNTFQMSPAYLALPRETLLGLPVLAWLAVAVIGLAALVFTRTAAGRALYAVGGNPVAAVYAGIDAGRAVFRAF